MNGFGFVRKKEAGPKSVVSVLTTHYQPTHAHDRRAEAAGERFSVESVLKLRLSNVSRALHVGLRLFPFLSFLWIQFVLPYLTFQRIQFIIYSKAEK